MIDALPAFERTLILTALRRARGKRLEAAKLLGWGRNTLTRKIKELGLEGRVSRRSAPRPRLRRRARADAVSGSGR